MNNYCLHNKRMDCGPRDKDTIKQKGEEFAGGWDGCELSARAPGWVTRSPWPLLVAIPFSFLGSGWVVLKTGHGIRTPVQGPSTPLACYEWLGDFEG